MTKIEVIKKTIINLENGSLYYKWIDGDNSCNAGVICKTLLNGENPTECGLRDSPLKSNFIFYSGAFCLTANLPLPKVYQELKDAGFTYEDIRDLVYLNNEVICKNLEWKLVPFINGIKVHHNHTDKKYLIAYLKEWVKILESEQPKQKTKIVYVTVNEKIKQDALIQLDYAN